MSIIDSTLGKALFEYFFQLQVKNKYQQPTFESVYHDSLHHSNQ